MAKRQCRTITLHAYSRKKAIVFQRSNNVTPNVTRILWNLPIKTHAFATLFSSHRQSTLFKRVVSRVVFSMSKALHHRCISWDNIFGQNYTKMYKREKRSNFQGIGGFGAKKKDGTSARASKSKCDWLANHSTTKDKTNGTNPPDTTRHHTPSHL